MSSSHVVIAPDKFKGSLTAPEVAAHVAAGLRRVHPEVRLTALPVADGGDGTVDAAVAAGFTRRRAIVSGPTGEPVTASYAVRAETAVVELAEASGLRVLPGGVRAPLTASSHGTGELIAAAVADGARHVVLGLGGSACTDGGAGMVAALGARLLDSRGRDLPPGGAALRDLDAVDTSALTDRLRGVTVVVASDVDSPLLGPDGAARVFAPQKGADPEQVQILEAGLARLDAIVRRDLGRVVAGLAGAGAAGGVGFGALAFLSAQVEPGIAYLLDLLGFAAHLDGARLVVTGEGSLDAQSLRGKAPVGVARAAGRAGVPVIAVSGRRALDDDELRAAGFAGAYALTDLEPDPVRCMADAGPLLERLAEQIARARLGEPLSGPRATS
ncbi:glycerate kinase [Actinoallomurus purpureus]|uniref:glycerate kinase n=1 Tax=Actinoallomurus purpureus TaxID=478114 RepID=UPI002092B224|nr:glycerate kinase [Actinoallomurus purpureus]MCO6010659.1 glycerate kinase [Actinoallomurus purpureus]